MALIDKLKKNSTIKSSETLNKQTILDTTVTPLSVPILNVALSGKLDGGLDAGLTVIAGPSKHFKTSFALCMCADFLRADPEAVILFIDTEFGSPMKYFETFGIDGDRVLHVPVRNIEEMKFEMVNQLEKIDRTDKVIVLVDSMGNSASKKELEDALDEKSVADMTRAKALKGLFRMVTPELHLKDIPMIVINHTYKEQGLFPKDIVSGGTGVHYSADNIWIVGRRQMKEGTEVAGYEFVIVVDKSRSIKEKSKLPVTVTWDSGIDKYSGLFDLAIANGNVVSPKQGYYSVVDTETGELVDKMYRKKQLMSQSDFWDALVEDEGFKDFVEETFSIGGKSNKKFDVAVEGEPDEG